MTENAAKARPHGEGPLKVPTQPSHAGLLLLSTEDRLALPPRRALPPAGPRQKGSVRAPSTRKVPCPPGRDSVRALQVGLCAGRHVCGSVVKGPLCPPPQAPGPDSLILVIFGGDVLPTPGPPGSGDPSPVWFVSHTGALTSAGPSSGLSWAWSGQSPEPPGSHGRPRSALHLPGSAGETPGSYGGLNLVSVQESLLILKRAS